MINVMKRYTLMMLLILPLAFHSCKKDNGAPTLKFLTDAPYVSEDVMIGLGDSVKIGLLADWNGVDLLKTLEVKKNDNQVQVYNLDVESAQFTLTIKKGIDETERWEFKLTDAEGHKVVLSLSITLDPDSGAGSILYYESITLGAQSNNARPGFFSVSSASLFNLASAFGSQGEIDLLCYYDETEKMVIASPGANLSDNTFQGSHNVTLWQTKNTTNFILTTMSETDFAQVVHDGPMVSSWNDLNGKRKAKELKPGDVYLFKIQSGKLGLFLVKSLSEGPDGEVAFALKVQE